MSFPPSHLLVFPFSLFRDYLRICHLSPLWGFRVFCYPNLSPVAPLGLYAKCPPVYKHVAPLGLNASRFPVLNPANPSILSILIQTTNALRNQPNRDTIYDHSPKRGDQS